MSRNLHFDHDSPATGLQLSPEELELRAKQLVRVHPFEALSLEQIANAAPDYSAMSTMFPYLQSAATARPVQLALETRTSLPPDVAFTAAVGSFLVSDELGINDKVLANGKAALPSILETSSF